MRLSIALLAFLLMACSTAAPPPDSTGTDPTAPPQQLSEPVAPALNPPTPSQVSTTGPTDPQATPLPAPPIETPPPDPAAATLPVAAPQPLPAEEPDVAMTAVQEYAAWCGENDLRWDPVMDAMSTWGEAAKTFRGRHEDYVEVDAPVEVRDLHSSMIAVFKYSLEIATEREPETDFSPFDILLNEKTLVAMLAASAAEEALPPEVRDELVRTGCMSDQESEGTPTPAPTRTPTPTPERKSALKYQDPLTDETTLYFVVESSSEDNGNLVVAAPCGEEPEIYLDFNIGFWSYGDEEYEVHLRFGDGQPHMEGWQVVNVPHIPGDVGPWVLGPPSGQTAIYVAEVLSVERLVARFPEQSGVQEITLIFDLTGFLDLMKAESADACP